MTQPYPLITNFRSSILPVIPTTIVTHTQSSSNFDSLSFFWGGAVGTFVGAVIILGLERLIDWITQRVKFYREKKEVTKMLEMEINSNIAALSEASETLTKSTTQVLFFTLDKLWLETYSNKFIDYTNEDSLRLYKVLKEELKHIDLIYSILANIQAFSATSKALSTYSQELDGMNKLLLSQMIQLKIKLAATNKLRTDNKIFEKDLKVAINSSSDTGSTSSK